MIILWHVGELPLVRADDGAVFRLSLMGNEQK
jgi:hypothetical protein